MSRGLVSIVTCSRALCHELSCQMLRASEGVLGGVEMSLRDAYRPSTTSTSAAIDIHTVRYRHRYRPMRMARDGRDGKEENSFSDGRCHQRHRGETASRGNGFLFFVITLYNIKGCGICHRTADLSAAVTPTAKRNSYRVAILLCTNTQGRGAAHLNPGLRNRNSYRVAGRKPHPGLPQGEGIQCQWIRI